MSKQQYINTKYSSFHHQKKKIISCICHLAFNEGKTRKHQEGPVLSSLSSLAPPTSPLHRDSILSFTSCVWWGGCLALHPLRAAGFGVKRVSHGRGHSGPACCTAPPPPHTPVRWGLCTLGGFSVSPEPGTCEAPRTGLPGSPIGPWRPGAASQLTGTVPTPGDGQVDFEEFVTLLGPKLSTSGIPEKFHGTDFDTVFWKVRPG